ncbi:putative spermidine/putrescine transport system ATP-binding protein [Albimonas donghaensis]|uniref:Putative spermidine/putrescine transport system ATP-binding protein n=1 Tax=Albimonas donghaensis TaxID=356660 RepID=A0A1H2WDN0_9RHOB|nr:ABC transporter ATP-binding protein [Albimonas donghaensis]SDW78638.1 putative spermidine/putrescine transport system ATP-binding protein [Albimonas donghaensis]
MAELRIAGVTKSFGAGPPAVERIDLRFADGELTALLGPSGCGKTTLLRMIAGLETPSAGRIELGGADITALPAHRRRFGMVFQNFALFPHLSVAENVAYALSIAGVAKARRLARAEELLELVRLPGLGARRVGELSGGQRQRVAIARALAQEPDVFLLDEPMSALDAQLREEMQVELRLLQQKLGITTIVVTHDQREAMTMADQVVVMSKGRAEQVAPPQEVYRNPANAFVAGFIGKANMLPATAMGGAARLDCGTSLALSPPAAFRDGAELVLACRPEWMRLASGPGPNRLPARVAFVRDIGQVREIHAEADGRTLVCELPFSAPERPRLGETIHLEFPPDMLRAFPARDRAEVA